MFQELHFGPTGLKVSKGDVTSGLFRPSQPEVKHWTRVLRFLTGHRGLEGLVVLGVSVRRVSGYDVLPTRFLRASLPWGAPLEYRRTQMTVGDSSSVGLPLSIHSLTNP